MAWESVVNTSLLTTWLVKTFVPALEDELQLEKFCMKAEIPGGMGNIARWNLFPSPAANPTALSEGTTTGNEISSLTTTGFDATIAEYGEFIVETNLQRFTQVSGSRNELRDRMSYGAARSIDTIIRSGPTSGPADNSGLISTTLDFYCGAGQAGGSGTAAVTAVGSAAAVIGSAKLLRDSAVRGFTNVPGHPSGHYAAVVSPRFELDMVTEASTGRMTWAEANTDVPGAMAQEKWVNGYMGSVYGTAVYRTQNFTQTALTSTSDNNYVMGVGGMGCVSVVDADPQIFINTASAGDVGNPYRNRNTVAWHAYFAASLLDGNSRVVRMYSNES